MGKTHRTAQGKQLDIERLRLQNELVPAIGNMRVNARGDQLGQGGRIVKSREQMLDEHYNSNISKKANHKSAQDIIPTKGGKAKRVETFEPGTIQPDKIETADRPVDITDNTNDQPTEFEDFENMPMPEKDKITGIAAGEKVLKGGLARAVAKTKSQEIKKNKPKRL